MRTFVLQCEGCGTHKPFQFPEGLRPEADAANPTSGHCHTCRTMTNWIFAHPDQRTGHDRRSRPDRRATA